MTQITKRVVSAVALLLFAAVVATPAMAQTTASVDATATVIGGVRALSATGQQNLDFGTVTAGAGAETPTEASWGRFEVQGEPLSNVLVEFTTLPTELTDGVGNSIGIDIVTDDGILWGDTYTPGGFTTFNPTVSQTFALGAAAPDFGYLYVGVRGTVNPPATAVNGDYSGVIVLTVAYP